MYFNQTPMSKLLFIMVETNSHSNLQNTAIYSNVVVISINYNLTLACLFLIFKTTIYELLL